MKEINYIKKILQELKGKTTKDKYETLSKLLLFLTLSAVKNPEQTKDLLKLCELSNALDKLEAISKKEKIK
jgi:hypothetical protein